MGAKTFKIGLNQFSDDENVEYFFNSMVYSKYYNIKDFNKMTPDKSSSLDLMHVNIS